MAKNNFMPKSKDYVTPGQKGWDEYYIDREIILVPKPVEGDDPDAYVLEPKIKENKRKIFDVINSQADDVGLDNALKKYALTGDPGVLPGSAKAGEGVFDLTSLPSDSAEYFTYIHGLQKAFEDLPLDLRKDMSIEDFTKKVINGEIDVAGYLNSIKPVENVEKKDGEK